MTQNRDKPRFMLCVRNTACDDLQLRKLYQVLPDASAAEEEYVRVIDESGEDYLYPAGFFLPIPLPDAVAQGFAVPV